MFLDACRDNPMAQILARSMGTRSASVGRGLARVESGVGTFIAFATQPGNVALDGAGRNSPFTSALVRHIGEQGRDLSAFMIAVRNDVFEATAGKQWPWENSSLRAQFFFKPGEAVSTPPASQAPSASDPAADAWKAAENTGDTAVLEAFIANFGNSFYVSLATARLARLKAKEEERKVALAVPPKPVVASTRMPGDTFKDCEQCPEMMVLPAGEFTMGSRQDKENRNQNERPQRSVRIAAPFAVGIFEVTKDQFETFVNNSGHDAGSECLTYEENSPEFAPTALSAIQASCRTVPSRLHASIGTMPRPMSRGSRRNPVRAIACFPKPSGSTPPGPEAIHIWFQRNVKATCANMRTSPIAPPR